MIYRGIVLVHGIGHQQKSDTLDDVLEPLIKYVAGNCAGYGKVDVTASSPRDPDNGATASLVIYRPNESEPFEQWDVREAWWAQVFRPSSNTTVINWLWRAVLPQIRAAWSSALWPNLKRLFVRSKSTDEVWRERTVNFFVSALDTFNWLVLFVIAVIGFLIVAVVLSLLELPLFATGASLIPVVASTKKRVVGLITGVFGEIATISSRTVAIDEAATVVSRALRPFLDQECRQSRKGEQVNYDSVTLIAHSGGCLVAYEALVSSDVKCWCRSNAASAANESKNACRINFITLGSALNIAWLKHDRYSKRDRAFWDRPFGDHVNWFNMYARYDPVPMGDAPPGLIEALLGEKRSAEQYPYRSVRVVNEDWPLFGDHFNYWTNDAEVVSRFVRVITDSSLRHAPLSFSSDQLAPRNNPFDCGVLRSLNEDGPARRRGRSLRQFLLFAMPVGIVTFVWWRKVWVRQRGEDFLHGNSGWMPSGQPWEWLTAHGPLFFSKATFRAWLVGALFVAIVVVLVVIAVKLAWDVLNWLDQLHVEDRAATWPNRMGTCCCPPRMERSSPLHRSDKATRSAWLRSAMLLAVGGIAIEGMLGLASWIRQMVRSEGKRNPPLR